VCPEAQSYFCKGLLDSRLSTCSCHGARSGIWGYMGLYGAIWAYMGLYGSKAESEIRSKMNLGHVDLGLFGETMEFHGSIEIQQSDDIVISSCDLSWKFVVGRINRI
jgi:hypothetical protein